MKKYFYWMAATMMTVCLAFSFTACGSDDDDDDNGGGGGGALTEALKQALREEGFTVGSYSWNDLKGASPILSDVPSFDHTAFAYLVETEEMDQISIAYTGITTANLNAYKQKLTGAGFVNYVHEGTATYTKIIGSYMYAIAIATETLGGYGYTVLGVIKMPVGDLD